MRAISFERFAFERRPTQVFERAPSSQGSLIFIRANSASSAAHSSEGILKFMRASCFERFAPGWSQMPVQSLTQQMDLSAYEQVIGEALSYTASAAMSSVVSLAMSSVVSDTTSIAWAVSETTFWVFSSAISWVLSWSRLSHRP